VHESLAAPAQEAGRSLQAYMRQQLVEMARSRARNAAALAELEEHLERDGGPDLSAEQIVADLHADRPWLAASSRPIGVSPWCSRCRP